MLQVVVDGALGGHLAGYFACIGATDAIGHNVQPAILLFCFTIWGLPVGNKIFIVAPDTPGIRAKNGRDLPNITHAQNITHLSGNEQA
jgi:hypothetical protein